MGMYDNYAILKTGLFSYKVIFCDNVAGLVVHYLKYDFNISFKGRDFISHSNKIVYKVGKIKKKDMDAFKKCMKKSYRKMLEFYGVDFLNACFDIHFGKIRRGLEMY